MPATFNEEKQQKRVDELHYKEAEELAITLATRYGLPYVDLSKLSINADALRVIPEAEARAAGTAAFKIIGKKLSLAVVSPHNDHLQNILDDLEQKNYQVTLYLTSETSLK